MIKSNKKIAIFVPSLKGGGAERVMATIASKLTEFGHEVDLLLVEKAGPYLSEVGVDVNIVDLNKSRMLLTLGPLIRYIRSRRPDVIMSAMGHTNIVTLLGTMLSFRNVRVVISERGAPRNSFPGRKVTGLYIVLKKIFYPKADAIVAISDGVGREMHEGLGIPRELIQTIYNPVDGNEIRRLAKIAVQHRWLDGNHDVFIAVGRLTPVKDFGTLLAAFSRLLSQHPSARLIVLGDGPQRGELLQLRQNLGVGDAVDFVGFQSNPYPWMRASDVYVLSSLSEGLSNSMLQAMACGLKIVSTDCEHGPPEILSNGAWGRLVPVGDPEALAREMSLALMDQSPPDVRSRAEDYSIDKIAHQYNEVLTPGR